MLQYPSILGGKHAPVGKPCIAFYKYDGSNLRWEWSPKKGWNKFGTRTQLFDGTNPTFAQAIPLFTRLGEDIVELVLKEHRKIERITAFTEFFGANSFAGNHVDAEPKELKLIDVFLFKKGFIKPRQFVKMFGHLPEAPQVIYDGKLNWQFIDDVRASKYPVDEGVVCKGDDYMVKIKTHAYFDKLYKRYPERLNEEE